MAARILQANKKYTFSDYFDLQHPPEEILGELGYSLSVKALVFPTTHSTYDEATKKLQTAYYELLPKVSLNSEIAKREFMIAPLLYEVLRNVDAKLNIEYPIDVDERLSGSLDYLIRAKQALVVVEAKKGDLDRGFTQLAAELIALDQYAEERDDPVFYGAITIGELWRFAALARAPKHLTRDIHTYRFPEDTGDLFGILYGILQG